MMADKQHRFQNTRCDVNCRIEMPVGLGVQWLWCIESTKPGLSQGKQIRFADLFTS
jgi:hypothetical protein